MEPLSLVSRGAQTGSLSRNVPAGTPSHSLIKMNSSLSGTSLGAALVAVGGARDLDDAEESAGDKLTIFQAFMVAFCIAFGGNVALIGFYVKVVGFYLFLVVLLFLTVAGAMAENVLHKAAIATGATSFNDMTKALPSFLAPLTSVALMAWNFVVQALYVQFLYTFINDQLLDTRFPADGGIVSAPLYIAIGVMIFIITISPNFSGSLVKILTNINLMTTFVVLLTAIVKGLHLICTELAEARPKSYEYWHAEGVSQAAVLLAGSMFQCMAVPRLQYELKPSVKERGSWMIPISLGTTQAAIFVLVGGVGYYALGDRIDGSGDVFRAYYNVAPDFMVSILQGGVAQLMFLSTPLLGVPAKSELWSLVATRDERGNKVQFEDAPLLALLGLNLIMVSFATLVPMLAGRNVMTALLTLTAGTAANWMNLFLPCAVIVYSLILPAQRAGRPWWGNAMKVVLILSIGMACMLSSIYKIVALITG